MKYVDHDHPGPAYYGAAVLDVDASLRVQGAVLTGIAPHPFTTGGGYRVCPGFQGGYVIPAVAGAVGDPEVCNDGAGPLIDGTGDFVAPGTPIVIPWLHTAPTRRTNLTLYNPDPVPATVTVTVTSADGTSAVTKQVTVPSHDVLQLNDLFSSPPFDAIRKHNGPVPPITLIEIAAARATIQSSTRLFAVGWVISNQNNTVTISLPR